MERLSGGGSRKLAAGYLEKSRLPPRDGERTVASRRGNVLVWPPSCLCLMCPLKMGLNRRRKCTGINPDQMTLDYVAATKAPVRPQKTSPDLRHCGSEVGRRPRGGVSSLVALLCNYGIVACCCCCDVNKAPPEPRGIMGSGGVPVAPA